MKSRNRDQPWHSAWVVAVGEPDSHGDVAVRAEDEEGGRAYLVLLGSREAPEVGALVKLAVKGDGRVVALVAA